MRRSTPTTPRRPAVACWAFYSTRGTAVPTDNRLPGSPSAESDRSFPSALSWVQLQRDHPPTSRPRVKGVSPVNRKALRKRRLRNRAWAIVAAMLPAVGSWATDGSDGAATKADPNSTAASASPSGTGDRVSSSTRPSIPPPRRFNSNAIGTQPPFSSQPKTKIPPPRSIRAAPTPAQPSVGSSAVDAQLQGVLSQPRGDQAILGQPQGAENSELSVVPLRTPRTEGEVGETRPSAESAPLLLPTGPDTAQSVADPALSQSARSSRRQARLGARRHKATQAANAAGGDARHQEFGAGRPRTTDGSGFSSRTAP